MGTQSGRVLLFESNSLGLLSQQSYEQPLFKEQGYVVKLCYCSRDEVVVAAYSGGCVKVFNGCHRTMLEGEAKHEFDAIQGGNAPSHPLLLRSNNAVHDSTVLAMAVSEELGLIAISGVDGTVRIVDYYTLHIR